MAATGNKRDSREQELNRPKYEIEYHVTSIHDDEARFKVRRNGKVFHIRIFPWEFVNSPDTKEKYMSYLEILRSGEEVIDGIFDTDVFDWAMRPFEPFFAELAPDLALPRGYEDIRVTLWDYLNPDFFVFNLDIVDEELRPRRLEMEESPYFSMPPVWLEDDFSDLSWTTVYDPAQVVLSFENPEDALFKPPRKVLIDNEQTTCFFKQADSTVRTRIELNAYKKIAAAGLDPSVRVCRLHGVVMDKDFVIGMLLTYIDHDGCALSSRVDPDHPPASVKQRWVDQLDSTISELHKAGVVWSDVKAENVLIDREDNGWIIDFGGGYTQGWVDPQIAGTVEGDLAGMAKLRDFIFQKEGQDFWWTY
ncbi:hypothetical protein F5Y13DRAFT_190873 [Hypoxylon sp. FL1857]|nr:hypothetical protein F5Y13DRAFT_190873 [Hypoxylon sp. FL1857]